MNDTFEKKVLTTIEKFQMLDKEDRVLVGFSGGPDSMALLNFLNEMKGLLNIKVYALHINHQLRAKAADEDEQFTIKVCKKMDIAIKSKKIDVMKYAKKHKLSIEESARVLRYEELSKQAKRLRCNKIAVGHNANDNVETVILNLVRGTGLAGLSGIPPTRDKIIRPLIEIERKDILDYLKQKKLEYCHDLTNIELGYRRNYIRHKIVPVLLDINPNLINTILRTSEIIRDTNNDVMKMAAQAKKNVVLKASKGRIVLDIKKLLSYNLLIRREIIKTILPRLEFEQIGAILALVNRPSGKRLELTKDYIVWKEYNKLILAQTEERKVNLSNKVWKVNIGKMTKIPELGLELTADTTNIMNATEAQRTPRKELGDAKLSSAPVSVSSVSPWQSYAMFDKSAITFPLSIRLRRPGDRFIPFKGKEKKLKEVLIDDKIPVRTRDRLPLLCDAHNILWIIGSRRSNIGLITNKTKEMLEVKIIKNGEE